MEIQWSAITLEASLFMGQFQSCISTSSSLDGPKGCRSPHSEQARTALGSSAAQLCATSILLVRKDSKSSVLCKTTVPNACFTCLTLIHDHVDIAFVSQLRTLTLGSEQHLEVAGLFASGQLERLDIKWKLPPLPLHPLNKGLTKET